MESDTETSSSGDHLSPIGLRQVKRKIVVDREDDDSRTGSEVYEKGLVDDLGDSDQKQGEGKSKDKPSNQEEDLEDSLEIHKRRRRKEKADESSEEEEISDLLDDAFGENQAGRIKSKASVFATKDISRIFEDEESYNEDEESYNEAADALRHKNQGSSRIYVDNEDDRDDMDDFITDDEGSQDESTESSEYPRSTPVGYERKKVGESAVPKHSFISEGTWNDINHLFGNGSDYAWALNAGASSESEHKGGTSRYVNPDQPTKEVKLDDIYETKEIEKNMLTEQDSAIRSKDIPERFQIQGIVVDTSKKFDYRRVINFIYSGLLDDQDEVSRLGRIPYSDVVDTISKVLKYMHVSAFEVPYIYYYRRDYLHPDITIDDLWNIYDLDVKYSFYDKRRTDLRSLYDRLVSDVGIQPDPQFETFFDSCETENNVDDLSTYLNFQYSGEICQLKEANRVSFKKVPRLTTYELAKKVGIGEFAKFFNVDVHGVASAFINNVDSEYPVSHHEPPEDCAKKYVCDDFPTAKDVLDGAKSIIAHSFASHPGLRAFIHGFALSKASITVNLTPKGISDIDSSHPYYSFKYVTSKKLHKFVDGQFAQMVSAENEGLLTIDIDIEGKDTLVKNLRDRLHSGSNSDTAALWDEQRALVADHTFDKLLLPEACKFIRSKLLSKAKAWIVKGCQKAFENRVNMAPFGRDGTENSSKVPRVLVASWGEGGVDDPTYFVALKKSGELHDWKTVYRLRKLCADTNSREFQEIIEFISEHNPAVIAVAGFRPNLKTQFYDHIVGITKMGKESGKLEKVIPVIVVYDEFSRIYMNSSISSDEFPENAYPRLVRYCVSLGRYVQDPVMEASRLYNQSYDITSLVLTPLQSLVPTSSLLHVYERVFLNVVSMCGVDINNAAKYEHASSTLQFVPGLGVRKALALLSKLKFNGILRSRTDLIRRRLCAANVFMNCAAFIRIRPKHFKNDLDDAFDVLDDTRIHPEDYDLARKMAADALDIDESMLDHEENQSQHVRELMESSNIEKLSQLALDEFAIELEKRINEKKKLVLHDIVGELLCPFEEKRPIFRPATPEQIFVMVTDESPDAFYEGLVVPVQVSAVGERVVRCKLSCGIDCFLHARNTKYSGVPLTGVFTEHQTILCKIIKFDIEKLRAEISLRGVDTLRPDSQVSVDECFDVSRQAKDLATAEITHSTGAEQRHKRSINHPLFRNLDQNGAFLFLFSKPQGSIVIYPSQKSGFFYISCKVTPNTFLTIETEVKIKPNQERGNNETVFIIKNEDYSEVDQIIAEYIDPLTRKILSIHRHSKFKDVDYGEMSGFLESQCSLNKRSCYGFIRDPKSAENILLVYRHLMGRTRCDVISATPDGYLFRKKAFRSINEVLNFFKDSEITKSRDQQHQQHQQRPHFPKDYQGNHTGYTVRTDTPV